ncbi:hypothetical protein [Microbacterium sp. bgisy189]|uniref:hypothetical protein n=1 Tax=Microbacterium sp. bgisy189 TaxID=3413798 RepID=UPI003EBAE0C7
MSDLSQMIVDVVDAARRRPASHWAARAAMACSGAAAQLWLVVATGDALWSVAAGLAIALGVCFPRSILPLLAAGVIIAEAAVTGLGALWLAPVAVLLSLWHACATVLSMGRPWARVGVRVRRAFLIPTAMTAAAVLLIAAIAALTAGVALPEAAPISLLTVLLLLVGAALILWPAVEDGQGGGT